MIPILLFSVFVSIQANLDSSGKKFYLSFLDNNGPGGYITLFITAKEIGSCSVYIPFLNKNQSVIITNQNQNAFNISKEIEMNTLGIDRKCVFVSCDVLVTIYAMNYYSANAEGYLAIPYHSLGKRYVAATYRTTPSNLFVLNVSIGIVAPEMDTVVTIFLKIKKGVIYYDGKMYQSNESFSVLLSRFQTFFLPHDHDLSGTIITSTRPISVVSGGYININKSCQYTDYTTEMLLPKEQMGKDFIVPHLNNSVCVYRILSPNELNTTVQDSVEGTKILSKGEFIEVSNFSTATISASSGVLVQLFCHKINHSINTAMVTVPSIQHFKSSYRFVVAPDFRDRFPPDTYYITIIIQAHAISGINLDNDSSILSRNTTVLHLTFSGSLYAILSSRISVGFHEIIHINNVQFGLIVYGRNSLDGYGYPAGFSFC